jgi:hypothetical protein
MVLKSAVNPAPSAIPGVQLPAVSQLKVPPAVLFHVPSAARADVTPSRRAMHPTTKKLRVIFIKNLFDLGERLLGAG